jgi:hypothetical protein
MAIIGVRRYLLNAGVFFTPFYTPIKMIKPTFDHFRASWRYVDHNATPRYHNAALDIAAPIWLSITIIGVRHHLITVGSVLIPLFKLHRHLSRPNFDSF